MTALALSLFLLNQAVPIEQAEAAFIASGFEIPRDQIQPLGPNATGGYHAIIGNKRYMYMGAVRIDDKVYAQYVKMHQHDRGDEVSEVTYGGAHVWTWIQGVETYKFYKQGDVIVIPVGVPHCVIAASNIGDDGVEQLGCVMVRSSEPNPQEYPKGLPPLPTEFQEALDRLENK